MTMISKVATALGVAVGAVAGSVATAAPASAYLCTVECTTYGPVSSVPCTGLTASSSAPSAECVAQAVDRYVDLAAPEPASDITGYPDKDGAQLQWTHSPSHDVSYYRVYAARACQIVCVRA